MRKGDCVTVVKINFFQWLPFILIAATKLKISSERQKIQRLSSKFCEICAFFCTGFVIWFSQF